MAKRTYLEAIRDALRVEMQRDPSVFLLGEDIGAYGGAFKLTEGFLDEFGPKRVIDTPLSESAIIGAAIGTAMEGFRPVAEMQFMDFISCCFHLITNWAAKAHYRQGIALPLVIRGPSSGGLGAGPFHSQCVEAYFCHTPGLKVVVPSTPSTAKGLLLSAIRDPNPVLFLEQKALYRRISEEVPDGDYSLPLGKARVVQAGTDLTVVTYGAFVHHCLEAIAAVSETLSIELIDLQTLVPLDVETVVGSVMKTSKCLIVHEDTLTGGFGAEISARIMEGAFEYLDAPVRRLASCDTPIPYNKGLEAAFMPQVDDIVAALRALAAY